MQAECDRAGTFGWGANLKRQCWFWNTPPAAGKGVPYYSARLLFPAGGEIIAPAFRLNSYKALAKPQYFPDQRMVNTTRMSSFSVRSQLCAGILIIQAGGYLNREGGEAISQAAALPAFAAVNRVVLQLAGVEAANSVGIAHLREMQERLMARRGGLALVGASPELTRTFSIMGLYTHAFKAESIREALALLS